MATYLLQRFSSRDHSTLGALFLKDEDGVEFKCFTLEDEKREVKVPHETRVPEGLYKILLRPQGSMHAKYAQKYPWHRGMLWLQNVPGFEWIYIHPGNTDGDTSGCILVGEGAYQNITTKGRLIDSVSAYQRLYEEMVAALQDDGEVTVEIRDYA